ncbi:site-specific integrase [Alphaproteobacteria bacterium LMG 31809]|uniref:Site-specific integrase n=1 Tax=Govanella unica TaxID=2975056 RepID=A0A9X3TVV2_9PROT|nr:site-specific integrase [Govania unica]
MIWDSDVKGFGLRVNADGSKTYVLKYLFRGSQRWISIGKHGSPFTPDMARTEAMKLLGQAKAGIDPAEARKDARTAGKTVAELCDDYFKAAEAGTVLTKFDVPKKASTLATDRRRIERHIKPLLGRKRVRDVTSDDIEDFLHDIAAGKTAADVKTGQQGRARVNGGKGTATRTVGLLGGIFSFAVKRRMRPDNPVQGVQRFKDNSSGRFLSNGELQTLGRTLADAEAAWENHETAVRNWETAGKNDKRPKKPGDAENPIALKALRLLILTGARKSEILTLRWAWVDAERGFLRLPDSKSGAKLVPLGSAVLELISSLPHMANNPHVFPGAKAGQYLVGLAKVWERIRAKAQLPELRLHDLRHSFASAGAAGGDSLLLIGAILGHKDPKTTKQYTHLANDPVRAASERISGRISAIMNNEPGAEIVQFPTRKA